MAMVIKPYQTYNSAVEMLESIGLTSVKQTWEGTGGKTLNFKFPDGVAVSDAHLDIGEYSSIKVKLMYDLNAHMIIAYNADTIYIQDVSLSSDIANTISMLVIPSETEGIKADATNGTWGNIFNVCANVNADVDTNTPTTLLPAYIHTKKNNTYVPITLKNCYVSLNTVYTPCQKFVDEAGNKWVALGGPLLYKVPATD
jgi:hypothetical protein